MKTDTRKRARNRLDGRLMDIHPTERFHPPPKGWIRAIRDALGMTGVQFAARLDISPQSAEKMEKSEAAGTIQIKTLRRAAEALDCTLVYALVPARPLDQAVRDRARSIAEREISRIAHTMKLEAQETGQADIEALIETYIRDALKERDLWGLP